jgi:hypothetical protein
MTNKEIVDALREKVPWKVFYWMVGVLFVLTCGSYAYSKSIADEVAEHVTKGDMLRYERNILHAIEELHK